MYIRSTYTLGSSRVDPSGRVVGLDYFWNITSREHHSESRSSMMVHSGFTHQITCIDLIVMRKAKVRFLKLQASAVYRLNKEAFSYGTKYFFSVRTNCDMQ